jgi:hypothetical protein
MGAPTPALPFSAFGPGFRMLSGLIPGVCRYRRQGPDWFLKHAVVKSTLTSPGKILHG